MIEQTNRKFSTFKRSLRAEINVPAKASAVYTATVLVSRGAAFVLTPFFTRLMLPEDYGSYALFNSYLAILVALGTLETCGGVIHRCLQKHKGEEGAVMRSALAVVLSASFVSYLLFIVLRGFGIIKELFPLAFLILPLLSVCTAVINLYSAEQRYRYKYKFAISSVFVQNLLAPAVAIVVIAYAKSGSTAPTVRAVTALISALVLAFFCTTVILARKARENERNSAEDFWKITRSILSLALPMFPFYVSVMLISNIDKPIISHFLGDTELAKYSVAAALGGAVFSLSAGAGHAMLPWIMRKVGAKDFSRAKEITELTFKLVSLLTLLFLSFAPELFSLVAPAEYREGLICLYPLALGAVPHFLTSIAIGANMTYDKPRGIVFSGVFSLSVCVALSLALVGRYGIFSVAISSLVSHSALFLLSARTFRKNSASSLLNANNCCQISLYALLISAVLYFLRPFVLPRIIVAVFILAILLYLSKKSFALVRERGG